MSFIQRFSIHQRTECEIKSCGSSDCNQYFQDIIIELPIPEHKNSTLSKIQGRKKMKEKSKK